MVALDLAMLVRIRNPAAPPTIRAPTPTMTAVMVPPWCQGEDRAGPPNPGRRVREHAEPWYDATGRGALRALGRCRLLGFSWSRCRAVRCTSGNRSVASRCGYRFITRYGRPPTEARLSP